MDGDPQANAQDKHDYALYHEWWNNPAQRFYALLSVTHSLFLGWAKFGLLRLSELVTTMVVEITLP